jgi:hypothetical protein
MKYWEGIPSQGYPLIHDANGIRNAGMSLAVTIYSTETPHGFQSIIHRMDPIYDTSCVLEEIAQCPHH